MEAERRLMREAVWQLYDKISRRWIRNSVIFDRYAVDEVLVHMGTTESGLKPSHCRIIAKNSLQNLL